MSGVWIFLSFFLSFFLSCWWFLEDGGLEESVLLFFFLWKLWVLYSLIVIVRWM